MKHLKFATFISVFMMLVTANVLAEKDTLVLTMNTGATIDVSQLPSIVSNRSITVNNGNASWTISLAKEFAPVSNYCSVGRHFDLQDNPLQLEYLVTSDGIIQISTRSDNSEDHLRVLAIVGYAMHNYTTFDGKLLGPLEYDNVPMAWWNNDIHHNTLLALLGAKLYKSLYDNGAITSGPNDFQELHNSDIKLRNYFDKKIVFIKSHIHHQQADYSWYNKAYLPIHNMANSLWSPIANNRNQNANLGRSFDVDYTNTSGIAVFIRAHTDNGMHSKVIASGLESIPVFSKSGGSGRSYAVACNPEEKSCWVSNQNCAGSSMTFTGNYPNRIEMNIRTTWSSSRTFVGIAVFGDIQTSNHSESPTPGDDNNPQPLYFELLPESPALCQLYGVQDDGLNDSQIFVVNPETLEIENLGEIHVGKDIEALDVHPNTDVLYAASGDNTENPGHLYTINTKTGVLTDLGYTGFEEIEGLSFLADTLWAWAKGDGLVSINPQYGVTGTLVIASKSQIEDLTWNNEGTLLYGSQNNNLWIYDGNTVKKVCDNLPGEVEAIEMLPNGSLLLGTHGNNHILQFQALNLETCEIVFDANIPATEYDDIEGIAWPAKACSSQPQSSLNDGLVAYYPFNGNANDESGNGNHGTTHSATLTDDRFGNPNSAYSFDRIDDYIQISSSGELISEDTITLSAWIYPLNVIGGHNHFNIYTQNDTFSPGYVTHDVSISNGKLFYDNFLPWSGATVTASDIQINEWIHIVIVRDKNRVSIYLNGILDSTGSGESREKASSIDNTLIGARYYSGGVRHVFHGNIDDVRLYNRALSKSEIKALYKFGF